MTAADEALITHLRKQGYEVGPRQLKRWRAVGLLASPEQKSLGRGAGRPSTAYPPEAFAQAVEIARCVRLRIPLRYVPLSMFAQDVLVRPDLVLRAYADFLDDLQDDLEEELGEKDPLDRVDAAALRELPRLKRTSRGRAWIRRSGEGGARQQSTCTTCSVR